MYEAFIATSSIAIGYSLIGLINISSFGVDPVAAKKLVTRLYPDKKSPGVVVYQLKAFCLDIKIRNYVLIPSYGTEQLAVGRVISEAFVEELESGEKLYPDFNKRRRIEWLGKHPRSAINTNVWRVFNAHQTVVEATNYAEWIDPLIYDLFKKNGRYFLVLHIQKQGTINARLLFSGCLDLFEFVDEFAAEKSITQDTSDIATKINLNSPGTVELCTIAGTFIGVLVLFIMFLNGGGAQLRIKNTVNLNIATGGLFKEFTDFLNARSNRKLKEALVAKVSELQIADSVQVENLLSAINASPIPACIAGPKVFETDSVKELESPPPAPTEQPDSQIGEQNLE